MKKLYLLIFCALSVLYSMQAFAEADGVVIVKSNYNILHTVDRFKTIVEKKGMKIVAHIKHSDAAKKIGVNLPPTELIIFGNPKIGSPLMACARSIALDLPQKMLIWQDRAGQAWLSYNNPVYIAKRHKLAKHCSKSLNKIANALQKFANAAAGVD